MANTDRGRAIIAGGLANHRRIEIIRLLQTRGNLCVNEVATECGIDVATASVHAKRLHEAGLIKKRAEGRKVHLYPTRRAATLLGTIDLLWEAPAD
ncbi:MAG: winged helix-turn-helix transcriptional regulator [Chthoniobacterales bacterium]|nr:winged helix-turn-helix transcriptional regulator [Chthoniobacterales bacterium]